MEKDTSATFMGTASFIGNSVISTELPSIPGEFGGTRNVFLLRNGGAVFNKVRYMQRCCGRCRKRFD